MTAAVPMAGHLSQLNQDKRVHDVAYVARVHMAAFPLPDAAH